MEKKAKNKSANTWNLKDMKWSKKLPTLIGSPMTSYSTKFSLAGSSRWIIIETLLKFEIVYRIRDETLISRVIAIELLFDLIDADFLELG